METPLSPLEFARRTRRLHADREAVVDGDLRLTYRQFFDRCDRWSSALQGLGVAQGDRVATISPNTHAQLESFYSVPQLGAVLVPINYRLTAEDFVYIVNHSGATVVCAHRDYLAAVDGVRDQMPGVRHFVAFEGTADGWLDYEGAAEGRDDHPQERRDEHHRHPAAPADRGGRAVPVDAADVPRQRLDLHLDGDGGRGHPHLPAQGRPGHDLRADQGRKGELAVRGADGADHAGQRARLGSRRGAGRRARGDGRGAAGGGHHRAAGRRVRLGGHAGLRADRDGAVH